MKVKVKLSKKGVEEPAQAARHHKPRRKLTVKATVRLGADKPASGAKRRRGDEGAHAARFPLIRGARCR